MNVFPLIWIHADDAQAREISDGDETIIESLEGSVKVEARTTRDIQPGVIVVDFGWGNPWDQGANVNVLTSDDVRDPVCSATPNRRFLCEVKKV